MSTIKTNARKLAYDILLGVLYEGKYSNKELAIHVDQQPYSDADRRLTRTLVYGVLEHSMWLEWVIDQLSSVKLKKIDKKVMVLLKLGLYQLSKLERIPESAAVNETVLLAKKIMPKSSGFINAILRSYIRQKTALIGPDPTLEPTKYLSVVYSHPEWLIQHWQQAFGNEQALKMLIADNTVPEITLRTNLCETTPQDLMSDLLEEGFEVVQSNVLPYAIIIQSMGHTPLHLTKAFQKGWFFVQDLSSMLVGEAIGVETGELVLDLCSAPGGKSTHIAEKLNRTGQVVARDVSVEKIRLIRENCSRLKHDNILTEIADGTVFKAEDAGKYDRILVDAPCSGLGIIRRKPEIRYNRRMADIETLLPIQEALLEAAAQALKAGGTLIYSTCTVEKSENQDQVDHFIAKHPEFEIVSMHQEFPSLCNAAGSIQILQEDGGLDGFYIAKLIKKK